MNELLEICGLTVELPTAQGWVRPVNEVSLQIGAGKCLGLVGESGSGKTMLSLALMGLLPVGARVHGDAWLEGEATADNEKIQNRDGPGRVGAATSTRKNLTALTEAEWRVVRGQQIAMIFQEPMTSLNPVMRVGEQVEEAISAHKPKMSKAMLRERAIAAMRQAALGEPERRAEQYPHQLSGGLRQRAMIAMALDSTSRCRKKFCSCCKNCGATCGWVFFLSHMIWEWWRGSGPGGSDVCGAHRGRRFCRPGACDA